MNKIQQSSRTANLTIDFIVDRKRQYQTATALSKYTITVSGGKASGTYPASGFDNAYFVPVYDASKSFDGVLAPDTTVTKFTPVILGITDKIYPVQCQWDFGNGIEHTEISLNAKFLITSGGDLSQLDGALSSNGSAPTKINLDKNTTTNWPSSGAIIIDNEIFTYIGKYTDNTNDYLTGVMTGQFNTTRANHADNSVVKYISGGILSQYYKYQFGGPSSSELNSAYRVTLTVIDNYQRKLVVAKMVYPKVGA